MIDQTKLAKLPKWAQDHLESLQRQLDNVTKDRVATYEAFNGGKTSDIFMEEYGTGPKIYLPSDRAVTFRAGGEEFSVTFEYHWKTEEKLGIRVRTGWNAMALHPDCSNGIILRKRERD